MLEYNGANPPPPAYPAKTRKVYTDAQKAEYYKKKFLAKARAQPKRTYRGGRRGGRNGVQAGPFATFYGYGDYSNSKVIKGARDPMTKIDPRTEYAFAPDYGSRLGSTIGEGLQSFAHALGFGEYNIQSNSCLSHRYLDMGTSPPRVMNTNKGEATVFCHREYLGELTTGVGTPSAFTLQSYSINPGNSLLFPFGARIAENFQEWEVRGMLVELKSEASETSTSLSLGSMFCAVDYNILDPPPTNKTELENLEYACSNKPSKSILMPVECSRKNDVLTHLYIAVDEDYQTGDKRLYDLGKLYVGSFGCPVANAPIAEIWITYEIALFKPHIHVDPPQPENPHGFAHFYGSLPRDGVFTFSSASSDEMVPAGAWAVSGNQLTIPQQDLPCQYKIDLSWRCVGNLTQPSAGPTLILSPGVTILPNHFSSQAANNQNTYNLDSTVVSKTTWFMSFIVQVTNGVGTDTIDFSWVGGLPNPPVGFNAFWDCYCTQVFQNSALEQPEVQGIPTSNPLLEDYIEEEVKRRVQGLTRKPTQ